MRALLIAPYYIHWHYGRGARGVIEIFGNIIWFIWHFFSVGLLMQTLFSPWQRLQEQRQRGFDIAGYLSTITLNTVMRFVGFLIRFVFIVLGLVGIIITAIAGAISFVIWLALPVVIIVTFIFGIVLLFKS